MAKPKKGLTINLEVFLPEGTSAQWDLLSALARSFGIDMRDICNEKEDIDDPKIKLEEFGFYELPKVKGLKRQDILVELLLDNKYKLSYKIAMLSHLEMFDIIYSRSSLEILYQKLAKLFGVSSREIKGNKLVLNKNSSENRTRYQAFKFIKKVATDYEKLKLGHAP